MEYTIQILINGTESNGKYIDENFTDIQEAIEYLEDLLQREIINQNTNP